MKKIVILVATAAMVMQSSILYAIDNSQPEKQGQNKSMPMGARAGMGDMGMMKQNMQKMMKQMDEIHATQDPKKRWMLMHEHMLNMHKGMKMMRGMGGDMMMGMKGDKKGNVDMTDESMMKNMTSKERGQCHQMMEQRMDMMQMMMEQMMGRMSMQEGMMPIK